MGKGHISGKEAAILTAIVITGAGIQAALEGEFLIQKNDRTEPETSERIKASAKKEVLTISEVPSKIAGKYERTLGLEVVGLGCSLGFVSALLARRRQKPQFMAQNR